MGDPVQQPPVIGADPYEALARRVRLIILALVLLTSLPASGPERIVLITLCVLTGAFNFLKTPNRLRSLIVDHVLLLSLVLMTGGLDSQFYPLFFLLIVVVILTSGISGFVVVLASQIAIALSLFWIHPTSTIDTTPTVDLIIRLAILVIFAFVAEQAVRNPTDAHLVENQFSRQSTNERRRLLALINSLTSGVLALDAQGKVYLYNAAALELLNTNRDISGQPMSTLLPLHNAVGHRVDLLHLASSHSRPVSRQDLRYKATDGSTMILDLTVTPVHILGAMLGNHDGGYMAVFRDITKEKSLDEERDEFISVTSHELRTPLAIAEANLSTAMLPGYAKIDPKIAPLMTQAHQNIVFLSELIADLATLSRAERGDLKPNFELIDAASLAQELARDYRPQAEAKHLKLNLELGKNLGSVVTSRPELREILQNFLTNAIKYTSNGSVTLGADAVAGGTEFWVKDTGIGVSASDKSKIFNKFYRSEDYRTRQTGGTGLGLYITHKLAEKLGAHISFASKLNHGSTFRLLVPPRRDQVATEVVIAALGQNPDNQTPNVANSPKKTVDNGG